MKWIWFLLALCCTVQMCSEAFKELWHPPQCPTSIYLDWKNTDDQLSGKQQNISIAVRLSNCNAPSNTPPVLFYLTVWPVVGVKEKKWRESGQKGRQLCCEGVRRVKMVMLTSSWPHPGRNVWVKPSVTFCSGNCLLLMTFGLLTSSLRVHQKFQLGQHDVFKLMAVIVSIISGFSRYKLWTQHWCIMHIGIVSLKAFYQKGHCNTCLTLWKSVFLTPIMMFS